MPIRLFYYFLIGLVLFKPIQSFAQTDQNKLPQVIPLSPEAASFQKYVDIPVNTFTGVPGISVPIYTINAGDITIPVSLSYHAVGLRVGEEASWVGAGWNLNATGVINTSIRGLNSGIREQYGEPEVRDGLVKNINNNQPFHFRFNLEYNTDCNTNCTDQYLLLEKVNMEKIIDNNYDKEPDIHSYNFMGYSGKFVKDQQGNYVCLNQSNMKIEPGDKYGLRGAVTNSLENGWTLTAIDGTVYYFGKKEVTYNVPSLSDNDPALSYSFYLSCIRSASGEMVFFNYVQTDQYSVNATSRATFSIQGAGNDAAISGTTQIIDNLNGTVTRSQILKEIIFSGGKLNFISSPREDVCGGVKLDKVVLYKEVKGGYAEVKSFNFNYSYFISPDLTTIDQNKSRIPSCVTDDMLKKRLKLLSLQEKGMNEEVSPYVFSYNESVSLPNKISGARDYWGFYNGKNNSTLTPSLDKFKAKYISDIANMGGAGVSISSSAFRTAISQLSYKDMIDGQLRDIKGADRSPDEVFAKAGILTKLVYPTGGFTNYQFELNEYSNNLNNFLSEYDYEKAKAENGRANAGDYNYSVADKILSSFYIDYEFPQLIPIEVTVTLRKRPGIESTNASPYAAIILGQNQDFEWESADQAEQVFLWNQNTANSEGTCVYKKTIYLHTNQHYTIKAHLPDEYESFTDGIAEIYLNWEVSEKVLNQEKYLIPKFKGRGLRVSRIVTDDGDDDHANNIIKKYNYNYKKKICLQNLNGTCIQEVEKEYSYGKLLVRPDFVFSPFFYGAGNSVITQGYFSVTSNGAGLSMSENEIGYSQVEVLIGENGELGKNLYYYHNEPEINSTYYGKLAGMPSIANPISGKLHREEIYNNKSGNYVLIKSTENTYTKTASHKVIWGVRAEYMGPDDISGMCPPCYFYFYHVYGILSSRYNLKDQVVTTYDPDGTSPVTTNSSFEYVKEYPELLRTVTTINSDNSQYQKQYLYPFDYNPGYTATSIFGEMLKQNVISPVIEERQWKIDNSGNKFLTSANYTAYLRRTETVPNMFLPSVIYSLETTYPISESFFNSVYSHTRDPFYPGYKKKATITYSVGFLPYPAETNMSKLMGKATINQLWEDYKAPLSYIWGYKMQRPIAEIKNGFTGSIAFTNFESNSDMGGWEYENTNDNLYANGDSRTGDRSYYLRNESGQHDITSATYARVGKCKISFWAKGSGTVVVNSMKYNRDWVFNVSNDWQLHETIIDYTFNGNDLITITSTGTLVQLDDLRMAPETAEMNTITYDPILGITSITDQNHNVVRYEYDSLGRLKFIRKENGIDEEGTIVKKFIYHYQK